MPTLPITWHHRLTTLQSQRMGARAERSIKPPSGLDFCSNDYLGLRKDKRLAESASEAMLRYGAGCGGARLLRGTTPLHSELEESLAAWKGAESCLLLNSGYQANASVIPALAGPEDAIFSDALNHASLIDGCLMAARRGAEVFVYGHLDLGCLQRQMQEWQSRRKNGAASLVVTDSIFSMDGDLADLKALAALCSEFDAMLYIDEAHATGLVGPTGAGLAEFQGVQDSVHIVMGTLGKALGTFGAYVCGCGLLISHLINACRGFIFSTALPAHVAAAALKAIELSKAEPWRRTAALDNAALLRQALGLKASASAIVPIVTGDNESALAAAAFVQGHGFDVRAVRPPAVPEGSARLRITSNALQKKEEVSRLANLLKEHFYDEPR